MFQVKHDRLFFHGGEQNSAELCFAWQTTKGTEVEVLVLFEMVEYLFYVKYALLYK